MASSSGFVFHTLVLCSLIVIAACADDLLQSGSEPAALSLTPDKNIGQRFSGIKINGLKIKSPIKFTKTGRQLFMFLDILTDVAMLAVMGLPFLGLVSLGALLFGPHLGLTMGNGRKKRSWIPTLPKPDLSKYLSILVDALRKYDMEDV